MLLFYKPIRSSSRAMHVCMFYPLLTHCSYCLLHLVLRFPARPYSGLVGKADCPPICFLISITVGYLPSLVVWLYKVLHTLYICLRWLLSHVWSVHSLEGSAMFLRVLWFLNVSDVFGGGSKVVVKFYQSFPHGMACISRPISSGVFAIVTRSLAIWLLFWWHFFLALDCPKVPNFIGGSTKLSERLIRDCEKFPRKYASSIIFTLYRNGEGFDGMLPFSPKVFLVWPSFLVFCEEKRTK